MKIHYPSFRYYCRFKILLHCRILNRQWHTGSDARWLLLPVLHPTVVRFRTTKKGNPTSMPAGAYSLPPPPPPCSLATAATTSSISSKKKIHTSQTKDEFNTSGKLIHKSIRASQTKEKGSTHHKSINPQIDSYITDKGAGFNTNKITHLQIDSHNIEGGEGRPRGGDWGCRRAGQVAPTPDLRPRFQSPPL